MRLAPSYAVYRAFNTTNAVTRLRHYYNINIINNNNLRARAHFNRSTRQVKVTRCCDSNIYYYNK